MLLATTALRAFWPAGGRLTCLGSWCLRYDQQEHWKARDHEVLPSPWDDRARFYDAVHYLEACYERLLPQMGVYLNEAHGVARPTRYWRILIGPWLLHFLHAAYDRYICLTGALRRSQEVQTIVLDPRAFQSPRTLAAFTEAIGDDVYNLQIFSELLEGMGYRYPAQRLDPSMAQPIPIDRRPGWRRIARGALTRGMNHAGLTVARWQGGTWPVGLCHLNCPRPLLWQLAWRTRGRAMPLDVLHTWSVPLPEPVRDARREGLSRLQSLDTFERLLIRMLPQHVPSVYLEAYAAAVAEIHRRYPVMPRVLVSANAWYFNDPLKYLAAEASIQGSRIVAVQHGSGYGALRAMPLETHETQMADTFVAWGWAPAAPGFRNLPRPNFATLLPEHHSRRGCRARQLLFVATGYPRYLVRFHSAPVGRQWQEYFEWQVRFLDAVSVPLRSAVRIRLYPNDYGHGVRQRLTERFKALRWDTSRSFYRQLARARLVIVDHPGTTMLEALVANVPTLLFWDPDRWELRPDAAPSFEALRAVGILHDSPEAAARHLSALGDTVSSWWRSDAVQRARSRFIERYAFTRSRWADAWAQALTEEIAQPPRVPGTLEPAMEQIPAVSQVGA